MLKRFSLYGFLKNQQYHEPFLVLAFLRMGLSFTLIGVLIGFREIVLNLFEIPSGAVADLVGRRRSLVFSMLAYIAGFVALGSAGLLYQAHVSRSWIMVLLFSGMMATAVGDAFRTGTHKAIIFSWLRLSGRLDERTRVYGFTRSFSKLGSAASVIIASVLVFVSQNYFYIFFLATIPYIINIVNILGYPAELEGGVPGRTSLALVASHMWQTFRRVARRRELRRLVFESMGFGGFFKAAGGYLQPILQAAAVPFTAALFTGVAMSSEQRSVILIGPVFVLLFVLSALASFRAHRLVSFLGHEENAARFLWLLSFLLLTVMAVSMYQGYITLVIAGFVLLSVLQNLWRPILVSRFDNHSSESSGATILSIESQGKSFATMLLAPLLGFLVDTVYG
ncbi:hypothetical protein KJ865_12000, partial [Myxococcota bacterium]|nr:hypothetical protein [Myxococcota bacterium]